MAFLYLGTCQARSEAAHPNDGKLKLLSWVTPAPSQSFLTASNQAAPADQVFAVSIVGAEMGCPDQNITLTAVVDGPVNATISYLWKIDGEAAPGTNNQQTYQFKPENIPAFNDGLAHEFTVEVSPANCSMVMSPVHPFVMMSVPSITLTGPEYTCASTSMYQLVANIAPVDGSQPVVDDATGAQPAQPASWQWFKNGDLFATTTENTLSVSETDLRNAWTVKAYFGISTYTSTTTESATTTTSTAACAAEPSEEMDFTELPELTVDAESFALAEATPQTVCAGSQFTLSLQGYELQASIENFELGTPTYEWYVDAQLVATTTGMNGTQINTSLTEGTHNVYVKAIYPNYDCSTIQTEPVTIEAQATPAINIAGNNVICDGQSENILTATMIDGATYNWTKPAETPGVLGANKVNANAPGVYYLTVNTPAGCVANTDFTVYQFGGDLMVSPSTYNACPGEVVVLEANYQGWTNNNITYSWKDENNQDLGNNPTISVTIPDIEEVTNNQVTYHVTATSAEGCNITYDIVINVIEPTVAQLAVTVNEDTFCGSGAVIVTAETVEGEYEGAIDWYMNGILMAGMTTSQITVNLNVPGTYTFAAAPANTVCASINPTAVTEYNTVVVLSAPEITITGDNVICQGATAILTPTDITDATYAWAGPTGFTAEQDGTTDKRVQSTTVPGVYAVTATTEEGCTATAQFEVIQLGGNLNLYASQLSACQGELVTLNAVLDGFGNQTITYQWSVLSGDGSELTANTGSTVGLTMGTAETKVKVIASAADACSIEDSVLITKLGGTQTVTTVTAGPEDICQGGLMTATVEGTATSVIWYYDGEEVYGQNGTTLYMNLSGLGQHVISAKPADDVCGTAAPTVAAVKPFVHAAPELTITGDNMICNGASTTLTATVVPSDGNPEISWVGPAGQAGQDGTTYTTSAPGVYTATASNDYGCTATADFTVYQTAGTVALTADKMEVCDGENVTLTVTTTGYENMEVTYDWGDIDAPENATSVLVTPTANAHQYTVTVSAGDDNVCQMTASIDITVHGRPSIASINSDTTICAGGQATFVAASEAPAFVWFQNGVQIPGQNLNTITVNLNEAGSYTYSAMAIDQYGCMSTPLVNGQTTSTGEGTYTGNSYTPVTVTVIDNLIYFGGFYVLTGYHNANLYEQGEEGEQSGIVTLYIDLTEVPSANVTVLGAPEITITGNNVICNGAANEITAAVTPAEAALPEGTTYTYAWAGPATSSALAVNANKPGVYTFTVTTKKDNTECPATAQFTVNQLGADLQVTASAQDVCPGTTVMLNANLDGFNTEIITYKWSVNDYVGSTLTVQPDATTTYYVTATTAAYEDCEVVDTITVNVIDEQLAHIEVTVTSPEVENPVICAGEEVVLTATATNDGEVVNYFYTWYVNGVAVEGQNLSEITLTLNQAGTYTFAAKPEGLVCTPTEAIAADKSVVVNAAPEFTLTGNFIICDGNEATITATPVDPEAEYTYAWSGGEAEDNVFTTTVAGIYSVTATDADEACTTVKTFEIHTHGADLQIIADKMNICEGEYVTLNADLEGFPIQNITYLWEGEGIVAAEGADLTGPTVVAQPTSTGAVVYNVTATADAEEGACEITGSITINVNPVIAFTTTIENNGEEEICAGAQINLTAGVETDGDDDIETPNFVWYMDGVEIPGQNLENLTINVFAAGEHTFAVKAIAEGCNTSTISDEETVTVNAAPEFTLTGNNIICNGATATITATEITGATYTWAGPDVTGANENVLETEVAGLYTLTVDNDYCTATAEINIYTNGSDLQVYADKMEVCEGEMVVLNANLDGFTNDNIAYSWAGQGLVATTGSTVSAIPTTTNHTYTVTATTTGSNAGCTMTGSINITVHAIPTAPEFTVSDDNICAGEQITLEARHTGNTTYTYTWYQNGTVIEGADNRMVIVTLDEPGEYYFRASRTNEYGCTSSMTTPADGPQYKVTVHAAPEFTLTGNNIICNGATATITATPVDPDAEYTYTWSDGETEGNEFQTMTAGTYSVTATDADEVCSTVKTFNIYTNGSDLQAYADKMEVCEGEMVVLNANIDGFVSDNITYTWSGTGLIDNATGATVTTATGSTVSAIPTVATNGHTYTVIATTNGTGDTQCTVQGSINITVNPVVTYSTTVQFAQWGYRHLCAGVDNHFIATSNPNDATNYIWYLDGVQIPGESLAHLTLNVTDHGLHYVAAKAVVDGCDSTDLSDTLRFYIYELPEITLTGNNVICDGDNAEITAAVVASQDQHWTEDFAYYWSNNSSANNATLTTSVPGIYTVTAVNTIEGVNCHAVASIEVTTLGADLQVNADKMEICKGEMITLNADIDGYNNETVAYSWSGNGLTTTTGSTVSAVPTATGNVTYTVTAATANCSVNRTINITVHAIPTAPEFTVSDHNICAGEQVTLEAGHTGNTTYTYTWYQNGTVIEGADNRMVIVTLDEPGEYYFRASRTNEYGCTSSMTTPADGNQYKVTVHAAPEFTLTGNNVICNGATATITATSNTDDTYTYTWSNEQTGATFTTTTAGTYSVTATDGTCTSTQTFNIYTNGSDLQVYADKMEVCEGEMVVLNVNLDGFISDNIAYAWDGEGLVATTGSTVSAIPTTTNHTYTVTATTTGSNAGCQMIGTIEITVHAAPSAVVATTTDADICEGDQATITAVPASTDVFYIWFQNGVQIPGNNLNTITVNLNEAGTYAYSAIAVDQHGCSSVGSILNPSSIEASGTYTPQGQYTTLPITLYELVDIQQYIVLFNGEFGLSNIPVIQAYNNTLYTFDPDAEGEPVTVNVLVEFNSLPAAEVNVHAAPDFTLTGNNIICNGATATINATSNTADTYTYTWSDGTTGATFTTTTAGTYSVTATDGTCTSTQTFNVYTNGSDLQVYADKMEICEGEMVVLNANLDGFTNDNISYAWTGTGLVANTGSTVSAYPTVANHTYTVVASTTGTNPGCTMTGHLNITVHPVPAQITVTANNSTICEGGQVTFHASGNAPAYIWYQNGVELEGENQADLTINFNEIGTYALAAKAVNAYGCVSAQASTPAVVNVVMQPTVQITGDPLICNADQYLNLYAVLNDTDPSLTYTYDWRLYNYSTSNGDNNYTSASAYWNAYLNINDGNTSYYSYGEVNDPWFQINTPNAQDYPYIFTVVVSNENGCRVESEPYYVYVGEDPEVVATVDYDTVCANGEITATAHLGNWNMDNLTAQWQVRTYDAEDEAWSEWTNIDYGTSGILHHVPGVTSQYRIIVTQTTTGCTATSEPVQVTVIVPQAIDHIIAINANSEFPTTYVCEGAQIEVKAYVETLDADGNPVLVNGQPTYHIDYDHTYMWKVNGMELQTVHGPEFSAQAYIYDDDPMYYVYEAYIVYDIPGCDPVPVASDTIFVRRNPIVTIDGNPNVCYFGPSVENVVLTAWVDGVVDLDATYTWFESGQYRPNPSGYDNNYRESWVPTYDNPYIFTVEVTNGDGCTTISDPFYVNVYERPYTNITADATEICEGGNVTLQANLNNYNDPMLTFQWYKDEVNNTHIIPGATHEIETFEPVLGATDYIVKVTHLMDFNTQYCVAYDTIRIDVNEIPEVEAMYLDLDATTICEGRSFNILAGVVNGGVTGGEIYTWYRNGQVIDGFHGEILNEAPVAIDGEPTVYTYAVSVKQSASGCESEIYTIIPNITVNPNPTVELVTDPIVCAEGVDNVVLTANVDPEVATTVQYQWMEDNIVVEITDENTYSFTKPYRDYPYNFSVALVNEYGCNAQDDAVVYVNAAPVVNITATDTAICNGGEITLTATLADWNADMLTFQWFDGEDSIAGATELSYTVVPTEGPHAYHVEILQLTSECQATSNVINVIVNADPIVTSITNNIPAENAVCDGYQVELTANIDGGVAGGEVYTWYRNGEIIAGAVAADFTEVLSAQNNEPTSYTYAVEVAQTAPGCASTVVAMNAFTVNPNPTIELVTDLIVCAEGENNVVLYANVEPAPATAIEYKWLEDNAVFATTTENTVSLSRPYRDYPYSFAVQIVNEYACSATSEAQVSVNANPIVNTTVTENNICVGGEITMTLNLNDWNADQLTFQWFDNGEPISGATSLSYTVVPETQAITEAVAHEYYVKVFQLTSECEAESEPFTVTVNPDPVIASVTVADDLYNVCNGAQLVITATPTDGNVEGEVYTWYRNGILMSGATAATIYDTPGTIDDNIQHYVYTAVVTRPQAGCTSLPVASATVTVYPNPVVVITGDQHVCETDSIFLIANVDTTAFPVGTLHFTWYESGQIRDNMGYGLGDSRFYAEYMYPRTEPYIYTVNVERNDVEHACASMSAEFYVYVYPQPVVNVTASETMICTNGEVTLTANLNDYNAENLIYQWYEIRTQEVISEIGYNVDHTYIYDTSYVDYRYYIPGATLPTYTTNLNETTTLGVVVFQTNSTCIANDEVTITVNEIPVITNVTVNGVASDTVCDGAQVTVAASYNANGSVGEPIFTWYRNGSLIEGATGASFSENVFTTTNHVTTNNYTVVVTLPASGCVSEISAMAGQVVVNPAPSTVEISGNNVLCENDTTVLTAYSDVEGEWTWSTGEHTQSIVVPAGVYTVTMKTVEGCEMTSAPFTVTAFGTDLLVSASATSICQGEHTTLYVDQEGWQGNVSYQWDAQADSSVATTVDVQPESTTTYHVTATVNSTNGSCTAEGEVTIIVHELPATLDVVASTNTICEGMQVTFTASIDPEVTAYIWYQNGVEIAGENQNTITVNFNEAGQYTFAAKAISVEGCVSAEASEPVTITVTPAPGQVTIAGVNVLCENTTTTLTAQSDVPGIFVWSTGDTATSINVPAGSYNVTMYTAEGCQLTSENFNVTAFGTDLQVSASATAICEGEHTTLYVDQEGWQGNVTYLWSTGDSATTVDVQPAQTTTYTVTATVASTNGSCTAEGEVTIVVTPRPAQVVVTASETTICEGNQITFNASGDAYAYIWYQNGVEIAGENQATLTVNFNEAGNYTFAAKAVNDQNCESALASEPVTVTVTAAPGQVTIAGVNVLCENTTTTLTAQSDVPGIFVWSTGDTATTVTVPAGNYTVTMITAEGCQKTSDNFIVEAFGTDLQVTASATAICEGEHTTLYVDQEGWQGNVTYLWSTGDSATTVDVQPAQTTTYTVTATVASTNGTCTAEGEVTIVVTPRPAQVVVTASETTICEGNQITFNASGNAYSYIWYQNGVEIAGENQATLTVNFNEAGNYTFAAKAVNDQNCESALASEPVTVTVTAAPGQVTITGTNVLCENTTTTLTAQSDVPGIFVWNTGDTATSINVPAGSYTVTMYTAEGCQKTSENFNVTAFGTDVQVSASATAICQGEHTTLYVDQEGWQGNVTYLWSTGDAATTVDVQPAVTTTYTVTATVASTNGTCTAAGEVTIIVNPLPVVAAVTATDTVVCEGTQVTFTAAGDANTTAYIWYNNGVEIAGENQATLTVNFNEAGIYNYAVKAISNEGCVSAVAINAPAVTVNAAPASVTISASELAICNGGNTTLYANVVPNLPATYEWFMNNVPMNTNTESIVVNAAGSYKVVAAFNGCTTESEAVVITVGETPQLQLTATETTICAGGSTVITAEVTGPNNVEMNYNWSNGFQGTSYTFTPATAGTYTFTVTASQATSGCTAEDEITITVNEVPATPVVVVDNAVVCDGGQVTLTVTNVVANATYTWMRNGVVISGAEGAVLTESPATVDGDATNYVYTVVAELPISGCTSATSANTVVTVIPTPDVYVAVEGNTTQCVGGSVTLSANVTPANANYNYQWYKDNVLIEGATQSTYTAAEVARETAYQYRVVVTANAGCEVSAYAPAITFVADPVIEATISNTISCVGGTATLTAVVDGGVAGVNGLNGYTFEWFRNNPTASSEYSTTEFVGNGMVYTTPATDAPGNYSYWVTVTSNYGCHATSTPVNYSVIADPVVTIAVANGYPQAVCNGGESMLKANVTGGYGDATYQWYKNGELLVGATNQTLAIANLTSGANDTYMVEVAQTGIGCGNSASAALNTLVTVVPNYTVDITGFGNVCEGGTLTLNANVNGVIAGDVLSYQWYRIVNGDEAVAIYGANAAQFTTSDLLLGNMYDYYVVVTSSISGCSVVSTSVPANVVTAPTVAIQGANTVCEGGNLTLNAFVNGGVEGGAYTYTWNWTGAANGTATTAVPTFVPEFVANDLATPYYVTVTISRNDNTGCTATSEAHEVNVFAIPTVSITADNAYICENGEVTFTAHVTPVGAYNYVWTINGQQQLANTATFTTTLANAGTITASVVASAANASGSCSGSAQIAVPVQVVAAPTVSLAANHTTMCVGGVTTLTATVNANNHISGNFNYEWIVDGAPVAGVTNTLNQTLTAAGVHTYKVRVSQNNNLGCASDWSNTATVQVAEQPVVTLSSEDGLAICEGGSITLTGIVTNYGNTVNGVTNSDIYGNLVFDWTSNGVNVHHNTSSNAMNQVTETLNTVGNYTYQVTVDAAGYNCQPQVSNEYTVNVVGNPSWTEVHVYSNNGTDACLGEIVYLNASIQGGVSDDAASTNGHIQWTVTDENGNTFNVSGGLGGNSYDIPSAAGTYTYIPTFVGNIGSGCQLTNTNDVQVGVTVHELPTAQFVSGDGTTLCGNDASASAELVIAFTGVAPFTYEVVDNEGNVIAHATTMANTATIYVTPSHATSYRINMISDNYCENPAIGDAATVTVYVNIVEFTETTFSADCDDNQVTIYFNVISGPANNATITYENGATYAATSLDQHSATFETPSVPGTYSAMVTIDGCTYPVTVKVPMSMEYNYTGTLPLMDRRWDDVVVVNCNPETNGGHNFVSFQWYHNGVAIPGANYSNYQDKGGLNGYYSVELTEQLADGTLITYMTCEYAPDYSAGNVKVYPVPAHVRQEVTIELELTSEELEGAVLDIYTVTGAHVSHVTDLQPITKISGFQAQGTYFGRILTGTNEIKTVKFIIVK